MSLEALRPMLGRIATLVLIVIVIAGIFQYFAPAYLSEKNVLSILRQMSVNGVVSIGLTFVIVLRRFDLSLAGVASLCAMTLGFLLAETANLYVSLLGCIAMGTLCGAISGLLIGKFRLPDVITTIAIGSITFGMAFIYSGGAHFGRNFFSTGMLDINDGTVSIVPLPFVIMAATALVACLILHMSRYGQSFYAVGENPRSARLSGVSVEFYLGAGFAICGALVGVAMILNVAAVGAAYVNTGNRILLPSYTAVYSGRCDLWDADHRSHPCGRPAHGHVAERLHDPFDPLLLQRCRAQHDPYHRYRRLQPADTLVAQRLNAPVRFPAPSLFRGITHVG